MAAEDTPFTEGLTAGEANNTERLVEDIQRQIAVAAGPKQLEPLGDCVVYRGVDASETPAGLIVPQKGKTAEMRRKAIVVAVGPGRMRDDGTLEPMPVRPGDWILLWEDATGVSATDHTGEDLYMIRAKFICAKVVPKKDPGASCQVREKLTWRAECAERVAETVGALDARGALEVIDRREEDQAYIDLRHRLEAWRKARE